MLSRKVNLCSLWATVMIGCFIVCCSTGDRNPPVQECQDQRQDQVSADLEPFLTSYFSTWSEGNMDGYRDHFHPRAMIYLVKNGDIIMSVMRDPFVDGQEASRAASDSPGVETMTSFRADEDRYAATVAVDWELIEGDKRTVGVDRFTLIRDEQWNWKITSLLYYSTGRGRAQPKNKNVKQSSR